MMAEARRDLNLSGAGRAQGGTYNQVKISGAAKIAGDLEAQTVKVSGAAKLDGNVKAQSVRSSGACKIEGDVEAEEFVCSGAARVGGRVSGKTVLISGAVKVGGEVAVEQFRSRGTFTVGGLLSADRVEIAPGGSSRAREIGGEEIRIVYGHGGHSLNLFGHEASEFQTETVEGDDIYLEATRATAVRGRRVVIGPGCVIREVEYSESLQIDPKAQVQRTTYSGEGRAPEINRAEAARPEGWAQGQRRADYWRVNLGGREIHNPIARLLL